MVIVDYAAVGADGDVDTSLLEVLVAGLGDLDYGCCLAAANALGLAGDADGAATYADLDEVCAGVRQEAEALGVYHVACAYAHAGIVLVYPVQGAALPFGVAFGRIYAENVYAGFYKGRDALCVIPGVDACAYHIALLVVQKLHGVGLVGVVVFSEDEV